MRTELLLGETPPEEVLTFFRQAKIPVDRRGIPSFPLGRPETTRALEGMAAIIAERVNQQELGMGQNVPPLGCVIGGDVIQYYETPMEGYAYTLSAMVAARLALANSPKASPKALSRVGRVRVGFTTEKKMVTRTRSTDKGAVTIPSLARWRIIGDVQSLKECRCLVIVDELDMEDNGEMAARIVKGIMSKKIQGPGFDHRQGPLYVANVVALSVRHESKKVEGLFATRLEHHEGPAEEDDGFADVPKILTFLKLEQPAPALLKSRGDIPAFGFEQPATPT